MRRLGSAAWRANKCSTRARSVSTILSRSHDATCPAILPNCRTFPVIDQLRTLGSLRFARRLANLFYLSPGTRTSVADASTDARGPLVVSMTPRKTAREPLWSIEQLPDGKRRVGLLWDLSPSVPAGSWNGAPHGGGIPGSFGLGGLVRGSRAAWHGPLCGWAIEGRRQSELVRATLVRHRLRNNAMIA